jgi:hypothetical protein
MDQRRVILLEANEIPFKVFDYFCSKRPDSAIARVMDRSRQYRTFAEDKLRFLAPWITWPSLHRGVNDELHGILDFGQRDGEGARKYPPVWSLLGANGIRTGVFSSMQSSPLPDDSDQYAFYFPDMFAETSHTQPAELASFQEFNVSMTRESARNVSRRISLNTAARVILDSRKLGLKLTTFLDVARQLADEIVNPAHKTRRRAYQPMLMFDVFCKQLASSRPQFCTFFTNHVAAAMHRYWAAVFPEDYESFNLDKSWVEKYRGEIDFAMGKLDRIVRRLAAFVDQHSDYMLVIATSMGQAAIPASHVKEALNILHLEKFLAAVGLGPGDYEVRPAMAPDFSLNVAPHRADEFESTLAGLSIEGTPMAFARDNNFFHLTCYDERPGLKQAKFRDKLVDISELGIGYFVQEDEVACTAQHVSEGSLIIYSPHSDSRPTSGRSEISALDFAPSLLQHFNIAVPTYMRRPAQILPRN